MKPGEQYITDAAINNDPCPNGRPNHGKVWTNEMLHKLRHLWMYTDIPFENICSIMGRSYASVIAKLGNMGLVRYSPMDSAYLCIGRHMRASAATEVSTEEVSTTKEIDMSANIETKTFIGGVDASDMTDSAIFQRIAKLEQEIDKLRAIRAKSSKLSAAIVSLEKDVGDLVAYVDGRDAA